MPNEKHKVHLTEAERWLTTLHAQEELAGRVIRLIETQIGGQYD